MPASWTRAYGAIRRRVRLRAAWSPPILANMFLHYVLDDWFVKVVRPRMKGKCFLIRFADDFVIGCTLESDARRIMEVLPKRLGRFGLTIHPEKSKLISFGKPPRDETRGHGGCGTFDFLDSLTTGRGHGKGTGSSSGKRLENASAERRKLYGSGVDVIDTFPFQSSTTS